MRELRLSERKPVPAPGRARTLRYDAARKSTGAPGLPRPKGRAEAAQQQLTRPCGGAVRPKRPGTAAPPPFRIEHGAGGPSYDESTRAARPDGYSPLNQRDDPQHV